MKQGKAYWIFTSELMRKLAQTKRALVLFSFWVMKIPQMVIKFSAYFHVCPLRKRKEKYDSETDINKLLWPWALCLRVQTLCYSAHCWHDNVPSYHSIICTNATYTFFNTDDAGTDKHAWRSVPYWQELNSQNIDDIRQVSWESKRHENIKSQPHD